MVSREEDVPVKQSELEALRAQLACAQARLGELEQSKPKRSTKTKPPEESYHALIKLGSDMGQAVVMLRDIDGIEGVQVFVSDMWVGITGYSREKLLGKSFFELVKPEDRQVSLDRHRRKISGRPVPGKFCMSIINRNGLEAQIELSSAVSASDGVATNIMFIRDVSERVKAETKAQEFEHRFQSVIDLAGDTGEAIVILQTIDGVEGRYVFVNDLWSEITGYSRQELLTMSTFDLIAPEHAPASRDRYLKALAGDVQPKLFEGEIITKSGKRITVELSIAPITYNGTPSAVVPLRDISEKNRQKRLFWRRGSNTSRYLNMPPCL
ncbi:MAG: PAS domain S-box protein [Dehalococcoidales bacterium]|jgi:PAS domain S-box-containing protein|nr:PAS domain S-box protein [Dehalococcoidales bacterium]